MGCAASTAVHPIGVLPQPSPPQPAIPHSILKSRHQPLTITIQHHPSHPPQHHDGLSLFSEDPEDEQTSWLQSPSSSLRSIQTSSMTSHHPKLAHDEDWDADVSARSPASHHHTISHHPSGLGSTSLNGVKITGKKRRSIGSLKRRPSLFNMHDMTQKQRIGKWKMG